MSGFGQRFGEKGDDTRATMMIRKFYAKLVMHKLQLVKQVLCIHDLAYKLKMYGNQVQRQNPLQRHQKLLNGWASAPNVKVVKLGSTSVEFHRNFFFFVLLWYNFQFVRKEIKSGVK